MVLNTSLLNTQQYKVRIEGSNPEKRVAPSPTPRFCSCWKGSLLVALDYGCQLYFYLLRQETPWQLVWVYAWSGFSKDKTEDLFLRFFATVHVKGQVLVNVFGEATDSFQQNLSPHLQYQNIWQRYLPELGFSVFLLRLFTDPVAWNLCIQR